MALTDDQFAALIALQHELRGVEFKPPGRRDDHYLFAQVTRAALGMANTRDGGRVIVGVEERDGRFVAVGLSPEQRATWRYDDVAARFASYADPTLDFALTVHHYQDKDFVVLEISEFGELPVLCRADYQSPPPTRHPGDGRSAPLILRAGACYVRSRRKPETSEIPTQAEMRELLDLAIDKGVRRFVARARAAGFDLATAIIRADRVGYARELRDTEGS